jgi:dual specificity MAP kinase phosphatase
MVEGGRKNGSGEQVGRGGELNLNLGYHCRVSVDASLGKEPYLTPFQHPMASAVDDQQRIHHGLSYPKDFLSGLEIIQNRLVPHTPIYAITAAQYAQLKYAYSLTDVEDSVLFPFLHGLEGDNVAQNLFFSHPRGRDGQPAHPTVPRYRGLMSVACPIEDEDGHVIVGMEVESGNSSDSELDQLTYDEGAEHQRQQQQQQQRYENDWTLTRQHSSSFSSASATTTSSSPLSAASTTATSLWSETPPGGAIQSGGGTTPPCADQDSESPPPRCSSTCRLLSSVLPHEIISPTESRFVKPIIPEGISL